MAAAVCAPTPPLLPTPPLPPLLPTPPLPPLLPTPPSSARVRERKNVKLGRASSSKTWNVDKLHACASTNLPGRASLSADWKKDKELRNLKELSKESRINRKRSSSRAPSTDRSDKKSKLYFAGPAFTQSPHPSELPIPKFVNIKSPHATELPMPSFLNAPKASSSD